MKRVLHLFGPSLSRCSRNLCQCSGDTIRRFSPAASVILVEVALPEIAAPVSGIPAAVRVVIRRFIGGGNGGSGTCW